MGFDIAKANKPGHQCIDPARARQPEPAYFGTLKCRAGYRHFLVRGFNKVRGEWSLMALCYNFTRVLNILGFERFVTALAKALLSRQNVLAAVTDALLRAIEPLRPQIVSIFRIF
jgi:hypothetical protein